MDDVVLKDLKQFIAATVAQSTAELSAQVTIVETKLTSVETHLSSVETHLTGIETRLDDLDTKVDTIADALSEHLEDHEQRIIKLERKVA